MNRSRYEYPFDPEKPNNTAASIFRLARAGGTRVLDLGSGPGIVSGALATHLGKEVTCVDQLDEHLEAAADRGVARTVRGDLSEGDWAAELVGERFDVIILADVLEHLVDPGALVERIREHDLLARDGFLVISVPNASHIAILANLAAGDFPYRPTGLLDETHLRFFTLTSLQRLLEARGFTPTRVLRTVRQLHETELRDVVEQLPGDLIARLQQQQPESDTYQYVLRVERLPARSGHAEVERLRRQRRKARHRIRDLEERNAELDGRLAELDGQIAELAAANTELDRRLAAVYDSRTWRIGRLVTGLRGRRHRG